MRAIAAFAMLMWAMSGAAIAQDKTIGDFFGVWSGSGLAKDGGAPTQNRDGEVTIEKLGDGFRLTWSTMSTQVDDQSTSALKSTTLKFRATGNPNVFHSTDSGDPLKGGRTIWAVLSGASLKVQLFILNEKGDWTIQVYNRILTSPTDMDVNFTRITNGQVARQASLKLKKAP